MSYPPSFYGYTPEIDPYGSETVSIRHTHNEIHDGNAYCISSVVTITASSTQNCVVTTPNTDKRVHFVVNCDAANNGVTIAIYESPTFSNGTPMSGVNRNRNSSNTAVLTTVANATISNNGTQIFTTYLSSSRQTGQATHSGDEFVLKKGTSYLILATADAGGQAAIVSHRFEWYEEDKRGGA